MSDKKNLRTNDESPDDRSLESLHRSLFDCPDDNDWKATRSLAQPSFLKQIDSRAGSHSTPVRAFPDAPGNGNARLVRSTQGNKRSRRSDKVSLMNTPSFKIIENHLGRALIKQQFANPRA